MGLIVKILYTDREDKKVLLSQDEITEIIKEAYDSGINDLTKLQESLYIEEDNSEQEADKPKIGFYTISNEKNNRL